MSLEVFRRRRDAWVERTTYVSVALRSSVSERPLGLTSTAASVVPFGRRIVTWDEAIETADSVSEIDQRGALERQSGVLPRRRDRDGQRGCAQDELAA